MAALANNYYDLSDPAITELVSARVQLFFKQPFYGNYCAGLDLVDASSWCKTMATDGVNLYYNRQWVLGLGRQKLFFVLVHEVLHCILDHLLRRGSRDPRGWNAAIDFVTNASLVNDNIGIMPEGGLLSKEFTDDMTAEEIYDILMSNSTTINLDDFTPFDEHLEASEGEDEGDGGSGADDGDGDGDGDGENEGKGGKTPKGGADGGKTTITVYGKDGPPKLTTADIEKIRDKLRQDLVRTAQAVGADKVPKVVKRLIAELTEPKMDWRAIIDAVLRSSLRSDFTYQRPSRRSHILGMYLPSMDYAKTINIACSIDASASMTPEMIRDLLSEVKGIMLTFPDFRLHLWTFDTDVHGYKLFTPENIDEIDDYVPEGGGGTIFNSNYRFMKDMGLEIERFVMFTDGQPWNNQWGDPNFTETLFVIHGSKTIKAPFGTTVYYDFKQAAA